MNCFQHTPESCGALINPRREHHSKKALLHKHKLVTEPPFKLGKPFVRQPRGDTRVTPEDKQRLAEQRAAEIAKRRADFNATNN